MVASYAELPIYVNFIKSGGLALFNWQLLVTMYLLGEFEKSQSLEKQDRRRES
jgi:hypothetical protein